MKIFDINGNQVSVDVRPSRWPRRNVSKSKLQSQVGEILDEHYPNDVVLEEFTVPGSRMSVDFFLPHKKMVIEVQGEAHDQFVPHFHGSKLNSQKFAGQIKRDITKQFWAENNGFSFIEIRNLEDTECLK